MPSGIITRRGRPGFLRPNPPAIAGGPTSLLIDPVRAPGNATGAPGDPSVDHEMLEWYRAQGSGRYAAPSPPQAPGGGPVGAVPSVQIHPVWEFPPANAFQFYLNQTSSQAPTGPTSLAAVAGTTLVLPGLIYTPPPNMITVLRLVSIFCDVPTQLTNVSYIVRLNGAPVAGFTFRFFPRIAANESVDLSVLLRDIPQNTTLDLLIQNNANTGPWTVGGALSGWSYYKADAIRLYGSMAV